jgi:hypothetical protein
MAFSACGKHSEAGFDTRYSVALAREMLQAPQIHMGDGDNVSSTQKPLRRFLEQSGARTYGLPVMRALQASDFELRYIPSMKRGGKPYIGDENSRI